MKAFIIDRYGSADRVQAAEILVPELREDDVLVQVHAAGVNLLDSKIRDGEFKLILPYRLPLVLGHDVAGVVVSVGAGVRRFKRGDEVHARLPDGRIGAFDYTKEDFADVLRDYDVVLNSLDKVTLEKSLRVLKPGGKLISISGPPDASFARHIGASWILRMVFGFLSYGIRAKAKRRHVDYSFLFMRADGGQLADITSLIDRRIIRPVVDRVFPFGSTKEAMAYVEAGRAKGKVVVSLK
jgi:NADPH:quinone reductase-like Zn-dependent oxidoreductase